MDSIWPGFGPRILYAREESEGTMQKDEEKKAKKLTARKWETCRRC